MENFQIMWKSFKDALGLTHEGLFEQIIRPSLDISDSSEEGKNIFLLDDKNNELKFSPGRLTEFIKGERIGTKPEIILKRLVNTSIDPFSGKTYTYKTFPYLLKAQKVWASFLDEHPDKAFSLIEKVLAPYYECIERINSREGFIAELFAVKDTEVEFQTLKEKLKSQNRISGVLLNTEQQKFYYLLSVFSIAASLWVLWMSIKKEEPSKRFSRSEILQTYFTTLFTLIFPPKEPAKKENVFTDFSSELDANQLLKKANGLFTKEDYLSAGDVLAEILTYHLTDSRDILKDAYATLIKCCERGYDCPSLLGNKEELKKWAEYYGSPSVQKRTHKIRQAAHRAFSPDSGFYFLSCSNEQISSWLKRTIPENWEPLRTTSFSDDLPLKHNLRFLFLEDDYEINIQNTLKLLEKVRSNLNLNFSDPGNWGRIEIVIRCNQEETTTLLDTACSFLDESVDEKDSLFVKNPIRIHLLDEGKRSADLLFAQHPLFYPLSLEPEKLDGRPFRLVILSDNSTPGYVSWLVREAFWLLPHTTIDIPSTITILSPYAIDIANKVTTTCPGFAQFSMMFDQYAKEGTPLPVYTAIDISDIQFPRIEYHSVSMDSFALEGKINTFIEQGDLLYFVIDSSSDLKAISLATRIRETIIRKAVQERQISKYYLAPPVVSVRCSDPDFAGLTEDLVVPQESEHENRWFNDWKLLSFGSVKDLFSWDELVGGRIGFLAECIHLQYCNGMEGGYDFSQEPPAESLWSYYRRLYNRESSYAAAISFPYRLYEVGIVPEPWEWDIQNKETFWSKDNREKLANAVLNLLKKDYYITELSRWEHTRWCCYLLSTGWLPATPRQVRAYMDLGVSRHSLQIARLHPCLCSWSDLKELYATLHKAYLGKKDAYDNYEFNPKFQKYSNSDDTFFQRIDLVNIIQTADLLRAEPVRPRTKVKEVER